MKVIKRGSLKAFINRYSPWKALWAVLWNVSEYTGISLGKCAPWVFEQMIGCKRIKQ